MMALVALPVFLLSNPTRALAEDPISVNAQLSDAQVSVGDAFSLEIHIIATIDGSLSLEIPNIAGITEQSRSKSEGTSISWGGRAQTIRREHTITIEYSADRAGKIVIPPIVGRMGRVEARSQALTLEVVASGAQGTERAETARPNEIIGPTDGEQQLFVRYRVDKAEAYVGEQILLDLEIFAASQLNFTVEEGAGPPALDGFWREVVDQPQRLTGRVEWISEKRYQVFRVWRLALFPLEAGERILDAHAISFAVNRSIFDSGRRVRRSALPVKLTIKPQPSQGRPQNFSSQNVGEFGFDAKIDTDRPGAGKPILLTLTVTGSGNIKNIRLPEVTTVPGFRVFPAVVKDNAVVTASGISGDKHAEILLMPETGGRLEIPSFELAAWNPKTETYDHLTTPSMRVVTEVQPGLTTAAGGMGTQQPAESSTPAPPAEDDRTQAKPQALRPLRFRSSLAVRAESPWMRPAFAVLLVGTPVLFLLAIFAELGFARLRKETPASLRRASEQKVRQRLLLATETAERGDLRGAYGELADTLVHFVSEKSGVALRGMTFDEARAHLVARGMPGALAEQVVREMERADYLRFSPGSVESGSDIVRGSLEETTARWRTIVTELETWSPGEVA